MFISSGKFMTTLWLLTLLLSAGFAIAGGDGVKWRSLNVLVIAACMGLGYGLGYSLGLGSKNLGAVPNEALPLSMMFGIVAALGCVWNNSSAK